MVGSSFPQRPCSLTEEYGNWFPVLTVTIPGVAKTKGSQAYKGHRKGSPVIVQAVKGSQEWAEKAAYIIAAETRRIPGMRWPLKGMPLAAIATFELERFSSHSKNREALGPIGAGPGMGDVDKLLRNAFDALQTGGAVFNDAQFVAAQALKRWAGPEGPRTIIEIFAEPAKD
jgi:Holliday junction resolvase RusA-like endonuclease